MHCPMMEVFNATGPAAKVIVSDWPCVKAHPVAIGQLRADLPRLTGYRHRHAIANTVWAALVWTRQCL